MKSLQECKDEVARSYKLDSWEEAVKTNPSFGVTQMDNVARLFAQEACREQREICAKACHDRNIAFSQGLDNTIKNATEPKLS